MRRFAQVDVFGTLPSTGNPLAVVLDPEGLDDDTLAGFSRWSNLSEVTYLYPPTQPGADYRVRIFTGRHELPFAGHPTLGSAHAWITGGGRPQEPGVIVQECGAGLVRVRQDGDRYSFAAPPVVRSGRLEDDTFEQALEFLGLEAGDVVDHQWGVNGPRWAMLQLIDDEAVRTVQPVGARTLDFFVGIVGLAPTGSRYACEVRGLIPGPQLVEDPVTGSLNAAVAQWLRRSEVVPSSYTVVQGSQVGAAGELTIDDDGTDIWVGGRVRTVISGTVDL